MSNEEIAAALDELGGLYQRDGADRYRVQAYRKAARAIRDHDGSVAELAAAGRAQGLPGIGKTLAEKIGALLETGDIPAAAKLRDKHPAALTRLEEARREHPGEELVDLDDVRGDLHCHTTLSDGRNTLEEMAEAARSRGYAYLAITDHSASHGFGDNVTAERLRERIEEVRKWNEGKRGFRLLAGSEVNIGPDGGLDYPDDLLEALDWVIASVHTSFRMDEARMTARIVAAIENPLVDCIGHPTGRLIDRREPYALDIEAVVEAAARTGTMIEVNGNPDRRDLKEEHARLAADAGVKICLNTDAHGTDTMDNIAYSLIVARGAKLTPDDVANTRSWKDFKRLMGRKPA